jgi:hypothetical protein
MGDVMYPHATDLIGIKYAKGLCLSCPVRTACLAWALDKPEPYGVWGGLDEKERAELLGGRPKPDPDVAPRKSSGPARCGTEAGYRKHIRRGEKACDRCREARNRARVERRRAGLPP